MFILQENPLHIDTIKKDHASTHNGALVSFEGIVRSDKHDSKEVSSLLYIANHELCLKEGDLIIQECLEQFDVRAIYCVQRVGQVTSGETAIWIGVWSAHRHDAFLGCRFIIEEIKKRLIIWKKEYFTDGSSQWIYGNQNLLNL